MALDGLSTCGLLSASIIEWPLVFLYALAAESTDS
jgi:hypothetical protein